LAYVQAGHVLLSRNPRPEPDGVDFGTSIANLASDYIIGWATGDDGFKGTPNTQPFRFRAWMYAQSGTATDIDLGPLWEHMPGYLQRNVRGKTPAEVFFHLFLSMLHDSGKLNDPDMKADTMRLALRDTVAMAGKLLGREAAELFGNTVVCNSRCMVVGHLGGKPLFVRHLRNEDPKLSENDRYRAILTVASDDKPGDGFEAIPPGSAVVISRNLSSEIEVVVPQG
jgi:glutamine amidotransferase